MYTTDMVLLENFTTAGLTAAPPSAPQKEIEGGHGLGFLIQVGSATGANHAMTVKFQRRKKGTSTWEDVFAGHNTITINAANKARFTEGYQSIHALGANDYPIGSSVTAANAKRLVEGGVPSQDGSGLWEIRAVITVTGTFKNVLIALAAWPELSVNEGLAA